jgi:hypothetical protein
VTATVHHGDCLDVLRGMAEASVDSVVTDPPYHLTTGRKGGTGPASLNLNSPAVTAPATDAARQWQGWGTALKPAHEPIVLARKPLACPTVAAQVLATGTGALNVDGCRVV